MTKLSDIIDGFAKTFSVDSIKHPKPRESVCRECEIVGAGFLFCVAAYIGHLTRVGKLNQSPGVFLTIGIGTLGFSLLFPPANDEVVQVLKKIHKDRMEKLQVEEKE